MDLKVNPVIKHLTEVIDEISKGELVVPNFQRPYVWKQTDIISLFESIYRGYPIGSLLFWETSKKLKSLDKIGPFELQKSNKSEINFIIDGHQRLSTLYGVLKSKEKFNTEINRWSLYFDLDKEEFLFPKPNELKSTFIAMDKIVNTLDFLEECQRIQSENSNSYDPLIQKAQVLAQSIITYKLTITQIKGGDMTSAVEIFSRLNTKGLDITPDQMLSALTYSEVRQGFKLADKIDEILESLIPYGFSEIDRIFIFRTIIAAARRDIYKVRLEDFANDKKLDIPLIVDKSSASIRKAADHLYNEIGVPGDKLLPYNLQFVFISEFFFNCPSPSNSQYEELAKWFWFTSYTGWFAGANSSKIRKGLDDIRDFAKGKIDVLSDYSDESSDFPDIFDFRYARVKTFVLFLLSLNPLPLDENSTMDAKKLLSSNGNKALHFIVANDNDFGNKMILGPVKSGYAKNIFADKEFEISSEILSSHGITLEDLNNFRNDGKMQNFISARELQLISLESKFVSAKGIKYRNPNRVGSLNERQLDLFQTFS